MCNIAPYGEWKSPISSSLATETSVSFTAICIDDVSSNEGIYTKKIFTKYCHSFSHNSHEKVPQQGGRYIRVVIYIWKVLEKFVPYLVHPETVRRVCLCSVSEISLGHTGKMSTKKNRI